MDTLENIRQKRLQFFSKYLINCADSSESKDNQIDWARKRENLINEHTEKDDNLDSVENVSQIFKKDNGLNKFNGKYNQCLSLDETKQTFNNHKLEEFKNIVDSSYQNHVLNKSDCDFQLSRRLSVQSANSFQAWNFSVNSLDESFKYSSKDLLSNEKSPGIEIAKIDGLNNSFLNCKIPYMSAYNIYEQKENTIQNPLIATKKLTSNGSSVTTSPTSLSSAESIKNVNEMLAEDLNSSNKMELKPPDIPKTSNLTFRKNLMKKSIELTKNSNDETKFDLNSNENSNKISFPNGSLNNFSSLEPKLSERNIRKNKKNDNIFNYLDDLTNDSDFVHDHSDEENTLDIFSNEETKRKTSNLDLKIDLSQLNTSDEEDNDKYHYEQDFKHSSEVKPFESNFSSSSRQQIKPNIIPNLMLDHIDDDRSVSVSASLAKSMCKEIDYKKEMEDIICYDQNEKGTKIRHKNILIKSNRANTSDSKNQKKIQEHMHSPTKKKQLPPPTNSAQSIVNNPDKPSLYRKKSVLGSYSDKDAGLNDKNSKTNLPIQSLDLFSNQTEQCIQNNNSKIIIKKSLKNRTPIWQSSALKRCDSASKTMLSKSVNNLNRPTSANLLTYSKLIQIESNIQKENIIQNENCEKIDDNINDQPEEKSEFMSHTTDWLNLPQELWLKILQFLKQHDLAKFGQACKTFNYLHKDNSLWRKIDLKYEYNVKDEWLDWIGDRRPTELNIVQCSGNVSLCCISGMFKNIGQNLKTLNLSRCSNGSLSGDNLALQASIRCPNVTSLDLSWTLLSNHTLKLIIDSFKKIESINLSGCNMIQEDGFNQLLIKHGKNLKNLEISGCLHFSSDVIFNIGCYCPDLEKLNISNCHRIRNDSIIEACPQWIKLKYIDLRGIKNIKNNCISTMVRKCPHLEGLSLGECLHIGDASVVEIATYRSDIKQLDLCNCKKISDASIRSMSGICSKIKELNLKGTSLTDSGLINLCNSSFIKNIEELNLSFLPISELVLSKILKNAENLKKIYLYGCYNIKHIQEIKESIGENGGKNFEINI